MAGSDTTLGDKICLVTGATSGMGAVTARALAQRGATVVLVGRDPERGATAVDRIRRETANRAVEFMLADLSSQEQVRELARRFEARCPRLNVLVNNVGALFMRRGESVDGLEMTLALNHLAPFLLTNLLLDRLQAGAPARVVTVSSYGHKQGHIDFEDLQFVRRRYTGLEAYRQSKLANVLFAYELARRLTGTGVTANAVNPGNVATSFGFNNLRFLRGPAVSVAHAVYRLVAASPEQGARTAIYLATSPEVEGVSGSYFEKLTAVSSSAESYDTAVASRLWEASTELTGLNQIGGSA